MQCVPHLVNGDETQTSNRILAKQILSALKIMAHVFWEAKRILKFEQVRTITSEYYALLLDHSKENISEIKLALQQKKSCPNRTCTSSWRCFGTGKLGNLKYKFWNIHPIRQIWLRLTFIFHRSNKIFAWKAFGWNRKFSSVE